MNVEEIREYCLSKKACTESFPFDETTLVFKVMGKMYAVSSLEKSGYLSLKCDPEYAIELREEYSYVTGAYHFNKQHWNGIDVVQCSNPELLKQWIDDSYDLIVSKLTKKDKAALAEMD